MDSWGALTVAFYMLATHALVALLFYRLGKGATPTEKPNFINQRSFPRVRPPRGMKVQAQLMGQDFLEVVEVKDISEGGLGVVLPAGVITGALPDALDLIVALPAESPMRLKATIRHGQAGGKAASKLGVEFVNLADADRVKIRNYVSNVLKSTRT